MKIGLRQSLYNAEIRKRRVALGLSQGELAKRLGVSTGAISHIETLRTVSQDNAILTKLAGFFGCSIDDICPRWLVEIRDVPKVQLIEKELGPDSIGYLGNQYLLGCTDTSRLETIEDKEWIEKHGRKYLTPLQKEVLFLYLGLGCEGRSVQAIATQLGKTVKSVYNVLRSATLKLRKKWRFLSSEEP